MRHEVPVDVKYGPILLNEHARFTLGSQWVTYKRPMDHPFVKEKPIGKGERVRIGQSPLTSTVIRTTSTWPFRLSSNYFLLNVEILSSKYMFYIELNTYTYKRQMTLSLSISHTTRTWRLRTTIKLILVNVVILS